MGGPHRGRCSPGSICNRIHCQGVMKKRHSIPSCGLSNASGTACHVNSVLQALAHVPDFVKAVITVTDGGRERNAVRTAVRSAMIAMWANAPSRATQNVSAAVLGSVSGRMSRLGAGDVMTEQSDAHEVYGEIADAIASGCPQLACLLCRQFKRRSCCRGVVRWRFDFGKLPSQFDSVSRESASAGQECAHRDRLHGLNCSSG